MANTHLVCFSTPKYFFNRKCLIKSAKKNGLSFVHEFTIRDLNSSGIPTQLKELIQHKRGFGYWAWKPFFIERVLGSIPEGDVLLYCDSGVEIIASIDSLRSKILGDSDIALFAVHRRVNRSYIKRDCFVACGLDVKSAWDSEQVNGSFQLFRNTERARNFVAEWREFCLQKHYVSDDLNVHGFPNFPEFLDHRHDQALLTLIALKNNIKVHRDPSQFGTIYFNNEFESNYPQIFIHHRRRSVPLQFIGLAGCMLNFRSTKNYQID